MLRISAYFAVTLLVAGTLQTATAQTAAPAPEKTSKVKLTVERLKEMREKWKHNRPKLKACRAEVKSKGLAGDERWFYIEDCMGKT
jgi:hypothetical protein